MGNPQLPPEETERSLPEALPPPLAEQQVQPEPAEDKKKLIFIIITVMEKNLRY